MPENATVNISMPTTMRTFVQHRMRADGFGNVSEYFRHLVREDQKRAGRERVDEVLREGLDSGKWIEADDAYWQRKWARLRSRFRARKRAGKPVSSSIRRAKAPRRKAARRAK